MMLPSSGHKGVCRVDSPKRNTHGWYVRVRFHGHQKARFFSDATWGGRESALMEAVRGRDEMERDLGKPRTDRTLTSPSARNKTGATGIQRTNKGVGGSFEVTWSPEPNVITRTSVSIAKHGEAEAYRRALEIRKRRERELYGRVIEETPKPGFAVSSDPNAPVTLNEWAESRAPKTVNRKDAKASSKKKAQKKARRKTQKKEKA